MSTDLFLAHSTEFDDAVDTAVFEAFRAEGFVEIDDEGGERKDREAFHDAVYRAIRRAEVETATERSTRGLTRGALARRVFPHAVGATEDHLDDEIEREVWERLVKETWNATNPNFSGPVQKLFGQRDKKLVMIRTRVTMDGTPGMDCVYVTESEELIFEDFVSPLKSSVRRAAEKLAKNSAMISGRNKDLAQRARREVDSGMRAAASLAKSTLELMSGASES